MGLKREKRRKKGRGPEVTENPLVCSELLKVRCKVAVSQLAQSVGDIDGKPVGCQPPAWGPGR